MGTLFWSKSMIKIERYAPKHHDVWDQFVNQTKNGVFFFLRDYMDYHSKFEEHSLLISKNRKLVSIMPANIKGDVLSSYDGLTFGGLLTNKKMNMFLMLRIFQELKDYFKSNSIREIFYKAIPHIYHSYPAEEDLYALNYNKAKLVRRDVSSTIYLDEKPSFNKSRRRNIKKNKNFGLEIKKSFDFETFMDILSKNLLKKYEVKPTHTATEISLLASRFPDNIKLFTAELDEKICGGVIVYASKNVAHAQYSASTKDGLKMRANDLIYDFLINDYYKDKKYFDFGTSTENEGLYLNEGLIDYKERFGARAVVHDFYKWMIE